VVFDSLEPEAVSGTTVDPDLHRVRSELAASGGESWRSGLDSATLPAQLAALGLTAQEDLDGCALEKRYGAGRVLKVPHRMHIVRARVMER
jgi:hypothetical protein